MILKNNRTMRAAVLLLALVLITSCFVGGTFAKYVTSNQAADLARVAKWGVSITAHQTGGVFAEKYDAIAGEENTVVADDGKTNVVAPGTKKENAALVTLSGKPEVAVKVTYSAEHFRLDGNWKGADNEFYCPLIIKVTGKVGDKVETETINCAKITSATEIQTAVQNAVAARSATYAPNTDLSSVTVAGDGLKISWEWPFEGTANPGQTDEKDTYLGNQAATATGLNIPAIHIPVTATVTQID